MDSKERFNNLVDELSTIDSITVKVSYFTNMSWATIDVNLSGYDITKGEWLGNKKKD